MDAQKFLDDSSSDDHECLDKIEWQSGGLTSQQTNITIPRAITLVWLKMAYSLQYKINTIRYPKDTQKTYICMEMIQDNIKI